MPRILNLNSLSKTEFKTVMEIANRYDKPQTLDVIIDDLKDAMHILNKEETETIIRKLRECPVNKTLI